LPARQEAQQGECLDLTHFEEEQDLDGYLVKEPERDDSRGEQRHRLVPSEYQTLLGRGAILHQVRNQVESFLSSVKVKSQQLDDLAKIVVAFLKSYLEFCQISLTKCDLMAIEADASRTGDSQLVSIHKGWNAIKELIASEAGRLRAREEEFRTEIINSFVLSIPQLSIQLGFLFADIEILDRQVLEKWNEIRQVQTCGESSKLNQMLSVVFEKSAKLSKS
jgi:hypothetical protein